MEDHTEKDQKQRPSPEPVTIRCIAGSKVLLVRNYLTRETKEQPKPERCLIQRVVSTETLPTQEPITEPIEEPKREITEPIEEPITEPSIVRLNRNTKVGLTLTAAVAAVGLWWYAHSE